MVEADQGTGQNKSVPLPMENSRLESHYSWGRRAKLLTFRARFSYLMTELVSLVRSCRFTEDAAMEFPSENDFLEAFGIEPIEVDQSLALCRYKVKSKNSGLELDFSFSAVMDSFQVVLKLSMQELAIISSENVKSIEIVRESSGAGVRVVFDICDSISEAKVIFEPDLSCRWWTLRKT